MQELSLHVLDLVQNSITADAKQIEITVDEQPQSDTLTILIRDNGRGMTPTQVLQVENPFYTTRNTRKIGLGIPLFKMAAEQTGGSFFIESAVGKGTIITGIFNLSSINRMPLGDMNGTITLLIQCNPMLDFIYTHIRGKNHFELDTRQMRTAWKEIPLNHKEILSFIREYLDKEELKINGGVSS